jgi:hypothetical protein
MRPTRIGTIWPLISVAFFILSPGCGPDDKSGGAEVECNDQLLLTDIGWSNMSGRHKYADGIESVRGTRLDSEFSYEYNGAKSHLKVSYFCEALTSVSGATPVFFDGILVQRNDTGFLVTKGDNLYPFCDSHWSGSSELSSPRTGRAVRALVARKAVGQHAAAQEAFEVLVHERWHMTLLGCHRGEGRAVLGDQEVERSLRRVARPVSVPRGLVG